MSEFDKFRTMLATVAVIVVVLIFLFKVVIKKTKITTLFISRTAIFAAFAIILYVVPVFKFPLPIFPSFLELHFDEVPLLIAGFAYGPWSGLFALLIKTLVKLPVTNTLGVGELADFFYTAAFIIPSAIIYKKHRNFKGVAIALGVGVISQLIVSSFVTTFLILDFYMQVMNLPKFVIMGAIEKAGIHIDSLSWPFLFAVALPFNALKDGIVVVLTLLLYKRIHVFIEKMTLKGYKKTRVN